MTKPAVSVFNKIEQLDGHCTAGTRSMDATGGRIGAVGASRVGPVARSHSRIGGMQSFRLPAAPISASLTHGVAA